MMQGIKAGLALLGLVISTGVVAVGDDQAEIAQLLETFLAGASEDDAAVHDRFWAEDLIYTSSDGRRFGKAQIMASLADPDDEGSGDEAMPPDYSARDIGIRVFGDSAIVTFRLVASRDGEVVGEYLNTGVFRRREPGWRAVAWQATRAASDSG